VRYIHQEHGHTWHEREKLMTRWAEVLEDGGSIGIHRHLFNLFIKSRLTSFNFGKTKNFQ
jgi:hypothetical protein